MSQLFTFEAVEAPTQADMRIVDDGLGNFNQGHADLSGAKPLYTFCREEGRVVGGILGRRWGTNFEVQVLWVHPELRGRGIGRGLMELFEAEARQRGGRRVMLSTYTFQAPRFYERLGYVSRYVIDGFPDGVSEIHFSKRLD